MIETAQDWLPPNVVEREAVRTQIEQAVDDWAAKWFAAHRLRVDTYETVTTTGQPRADWRVYGAAVAIACPRTGRLAVLALDAEHDGGLPNENDGRLIEALENDLLSDLACSVETALGMPASGAGEARSVDNPFDRFGGVRLLVAEAKRAATLTVAIPIAALLPACRRSLPPSVRKATHLADRREALAGIPIEIEARLGLARVTVEELGHLSVGDVLVLDTPLKGPVAITDPESSEVLAHGVLGQEAGSIVLTLQP